MLGRFDPGNDDAVGADVERPLDQAAVQLGDADQGDRVAADGRPQVLDDFLPIEMAVLGVDHHPVQAQGHRHLGDARRFERDPQAEHRLVGRKLAAEAADGGSLHVPVAEFARIQAPNSHEFGYGAGLVWPEFGL